MRPDFETRFWAKVNHYGPIPRRCPKLGRCWIWMAALHSNGYGLFWKDGKHVRAHLIAYELLCGPVPKGCEPDHLCRRRRCINPAHIEFVTHKENVLRGNGVCALNARKRRCPRGHRYTEANTIRETDGHRECRQCKQKRDREYMRTKRAQAKAVSLGNDLGRVQRAKT